MIGRGRRNGATEYLDVALDILCPRGHKVGTAWKHVAPDPNPGYRVSSFAWTETENGGALRAVCPKCRADVQLQWNRVRVVLDENEISGQSRGTFQPDAPKL